MFRLMIAEDEFLIREGLVNGFEWEKMGFNLVASAKDGKEALAFYYQYKPQVILMDIKMPGLTGLEVLGKIKEEDPTVEIILLSGYDNFHYAKEGLRLGAFDYIEKINITEELEGVFLRVQKHMKKNLETEQEYQNLLNLKNNQLFLQFLQGEAREFTLNPSKTYTWCVAVIHCDKEVNIVEKLGKFKSRLQFIMGFKGDFYIVIFWGHYSSKLFGEILNKTVFELANFIEKQSIYEVTIGMGRMKDRISDIPLCYHEAMKVLDQARKKEIKGIHFYKNDEQDLKEITKNLYSSMIENLQMMNYKEVKQKVYKIFDEYLKSPTMFIEDIRLFCVDFLIQIKNIAEQNNIDIYGLIIEYIQGVEDQDSFLELEYWFMIVLENLLNILETKMFKEKYKNVYLAKQFVDTHFEKGIGMEEVAKQFYMSPSHFSVKFKELTGKPFSRYIIDKRIEKACLLLKNTKFKIYEIANQVGYKDEKHFSKLFSEMKQMTPSEYRSREDTIVK